MYNKELVQYIRNDKQDFETLNRLKRGLVDEADPVTWRTAMVDCRRLFLNKAAAGESDLNPDYVPPPEEMREEIESFAQELFLDSPMERLLPEFISAVFDTEHAPNMVLPALEAIIYNARHLPEPMVYDLYREFEKRDLSAAVVNPVGHYGDKSTRIIGPRSLFRPVNHLIFLASTQESDGGDVGVLVQPFSLLREELFTPQLSNITVILPMYGGSRGHTKGQSVGGMKEVYEAAEHAATIALKFNEAMSYFAEEGIDVSHIKVKIASIDIHNLAMPQGVFAKKGLEFVSVSPAREFAVEVISHMRNKMEDFTTVPLQVVASDEGATKRTEELAYELLGGFEGTRDYLDVVYIDKERLTAGIVNTAEIAQVKRWRIIDGDFIGELISPDESYWQREKVVVSCDDMVDTAGTQTTDSFLIREINYENVRYYMSVATHPVLSKKSDKLDRAPIDHYFLGDTLRASPALLARPDVSIVSLAPALYRELFAD